MKGYKRSDAKHPEQLQEDEQSGRKHRPITDEHRREVLIHVDTERLIEEGFSDDRKKWWGRNEDR